MFKKATRLQSKLRMTIDGPAGSGKTYTALRFAHALARGGKIAFIDTERGSASKYVGESPDGIPWEFDVLELVQFSPEKYTEAIVAAGKMGYAVLVIDSLSHAWEGTGGALEIKQKYGESWSAWRHVTPIHNRMVDAILQAPCHVITTMRSRIEYVQETDSNGRTVIRKVGMSPIQRPGMEYEFDILGDMDWAHMFTVSKSRCSAVADKSFEKPGAEFMSPVIEWLSSGDSERSYVPPTVTTETPAFVEAEKPQYPTAQVWGKTLDQLMTEYGVDAILEANGGAIPGTDEEVQIVAALLEAIRGT
jgi:hypothetical protein